MTPWPMELVVQKLKNIPDPTKLHPNKDAPRRG